MRKRASNFYVRRGHAASGERVRGESPHEATATRVAKSPLPAWTAEVSKSEQSRTFARQELISASWAYRKLVERHLVKRGPRQPQRRVTCSWCGTEASTYLYSSTRYGNHLDDRSRVCPGSHGLVLDVKRSA
jgi:hypothetical protein